MKHYLRFFHILFNPIKYMHFSLVIKDEIATHYTYGKDHKIKQ